MEKGKHQVVVKKNAATAKLEVNNLSTDDVFKFMDLYFDRNMILYGHLYNSFNKFLDEDVKAFLENGDHTFFEKATATQIIRYKFKYSDVAIKPPVLENDIEPMFPSDARNRSLTYAGKLVARVKQLQEIIEIATDEKVVREIGKEEENVPIATLPIMVRSAYCSLMLHKGKDKSECEYDPGGYFIVNGSEKVVIAQDKMCENKPLVFTRKDSGGEVFTVQVNSKSYKPHGIAQIISIRLKKDGILTIKVPILSEINVLIVLRALGIESDKDLINYIVYDDNDHDMIDVLRTSLDECKNEKGMKILTQEDALEYLMTKMRVIKKYSETDKVVRQQQKRLHLKTLLETGFIPHVENDMMQKAVYICYMLNKLLRCAIGRIPKDDRDSYVNKRIDLPGTLIEELFRQFYRKMINDCNKFFKKRNPNDEDPINIINQIKPNVIEQGLKTALLTGSWIRRKGVAQMLQRLTFLYTMSSLRRIDAPGGDAATNKLTGPRHLHASSVRWLCLTGDTEVLMGDNATVKQLKDIQDGEEIMSMHTNSLRDCISGVKNWFKRGPEPIKKITTLSGREIKCTLDHKLLVQIADGKYDFREVGKMVEGDMLITRHMVKHIPIDKETKFILKSEDIDKQYIDDLCETGLIDRVIPQHKLEIIARLLGANITDGNCAVRQSGKGIGRLYDCSFCVGDFRDAREIRYDLMTLGFDPPSMEFVKKQFYHQRNGRYITHNIIKVIKNGAFAYFMYKMGAFLGRKTKSVRKLPDWLINANKPIKREFLSGFQGGDGCRIVYQTNTKYDKVCIGPTLQTTYPDFLDETLEYMKSVQSMFAEFNISTSISKEQLFLKDKPKTEDIDQFAGRYDIQDNIIENPDDLTEDCLIDKEEIDNGIYDSWQVYLDFSHSYENVAKYADLIDYRYCNHKRKVSALAIEYTKYRNFVQQSKQKDYDTIEDLYQEYEYGPSQIIEQTGINASIVKRVISELNKGKKPVPRALAGDCIKYADFRKLYLVSDGNLLSPIKSIVDVKPEMVYDFETVTSSHTFIANGLCTSNCPVQTPEHSKVGLTKHLSLIGTVSILQTSQLALIKSFLKKKLTNIQDIAAHKLKNLTKVFLNGEWLGLTAEPFVLDRELRQNKLNGSFDPTVSIVNDILEKEIRVYCDGGRGYAPAIRVENNVIKLTKEHLKSISLNRAQTDKITSWDEFMIKNPGVVEYVDMEEQQFLLFADKISTVEEMRKQMISSIEKVKFVTSNKTDNRYDDMMFVRYTHCEFHPAFLIGEIVSTIPFCNSNQGPRNIFFYSQGRQAMGIYISNYRDRLDISYILYHPQRPLVMTRTSKYTYADILPSGENVIVAIACYTG